MNTIDSFEREIIYQLTDLKELLRRLEIKQISPDQQEKCVFTGAGDSFAATMIVEAASNYRIRCIDPSYIRLNPLTVKDRILYTVSVSGSTKANIEAAKIAKKVALGTIAITANTNSKLAKICDQVVELKFRNSGVLTAGSIGFTACMLACLLFVKRVHLGNVKDLFRLARKEADNLKISQHMFIVGSLLSYPLSMYGCAKMYEVLGIKAQYAMLEQFCHMELFSVKKSDTIMILTNASKENELYSKLKSAGYNVYVSKSKGNNLEQKLLYHALFLQLVTLLNAKKQNLRECYFVRNDKLRNISSALIY
ncbi:MAG: hypothetical protein QXU32_03705 [Nitrososphaerales archaeon]